MRKINNVREALVETTHKRRKQSIGTCIFFVARIEYTYSKFGRRSPSKFAWGIYKMMQEKRRKERL